LRLLFSKLNQADQILLVVAVMVAVMAAVVVVVVIAMIFMIPVAFVHPPSLLVVVIVGMAIVGAGVGRLLPASTNPYVPTVLIAPIALGPNVSLSGSLRTNLIPQGWRVSADIDAYL
jgi:hypothetical protein